MAHKQSRTGATRKLFVTEYHKYEDHLLRLDVESRRMRFGMSVGDEFIVQYAHRLNDMKSIVFGHIIGGEVRAAAELRPLGSHMRGEAEAAFSVEKPYQNSGIGTELLGRVVRAAQPLDFSHLYELPGFEQEDAGGREKARRDPHIRRGRCGRESRTFPGALFFNLARGCRGRDRFCHGDARLTAPFFARRLRHGIDP